MLYNVKFYNPFAQDDVVYLTEADSEAEAKVITWAVGCPYQDISRWPFNPEDYQVWRFSTKAEATKEKAIEKVNESLYNKNLELSKKYEEM